MEDEDRKALLERGTLIYLVLLIRFSNPLQIKFIV